MGDPKKQKKKFSKPLHPWNKARIEAEREVLKAYGLRRKRELWKVDTMLKGLLRQAKSILGSRTAQSEIEKYQLLKKVYRLGLLPKDSKVEDILSLSVKDILERRLQTIVYRKNLAKSVLQARQIITHEHIAIDSKKIKSPAYLVLISEEPLIKYAVDSNIKNTMIAQIKPKAEAQ